MNDEQIAALSRKIAEHFEPEPKWSWPPQEEGIDSHIPRFKWWYYDVGKDSWHPYPIDRAEIAMRLLKWLLERGWKAKWTKSDDFEVWITGTPDDGYTDKSLELAIALAVEKVIDEKGAR